MGKVLQLGWEIAMIKNVDLNKAFSMVEKADINPCRVHGPRAQIIDIMRWSAYGRKKEPVIKSKADTEEKKAPWE